MLKTCLDDISGAEVDILVGRIHESFHDFSPLRKYIRQYEMAERHLGFHADRPAVAIRRTFTFTYAGLDNIYHGAFCNYNSKRIAYVATGIEPDRDQLNYCAGSYYYKPSSEP